MDSVTAFCCQRRRNHYRLARSSPSETASFSIDGLSAAYPQLAPALLSLLHGTSSSLEKLAVSDGEERANR